MEFYHINHTTDYNPYPKMEVGDVIKTSNKNYNPFYNNVLNGAKKFDLSDSKSVPILEFFKMLSKGKYDHIKPLNDPKNVAHFASIYLEQFIKFTRETHFENIRRKEFPNRPSRLNCIWLAKNLEEAKYWKNRLTERTNPRILKVKVEHKPFTANEGHLIQEAEETDKTLERARSYWKGNSADGKDEILYEGKLSILEIF